MKTYKIFIILISFAFSVCSLYAQNIINTFGNSSQFRLKDGLANNFFTLYQVGGQFSIDNSLRLENTVNSTTGILFKGNDRFLHNYGNGNLFFGINSGNFTVSGYNNTGLGWRTLIFVTTGYQNLAIGFNTLSSNSTGYNNTGIGTANLENNSTGNLNTSTGSFSMYQNSTGSSNTSVGVNSLRNNTEGNFNSSFGFSSMFSNNSGNFNSSFGVNALFLNTTGSMNTAFGFSSLASNTSGTRNSAFGSYSLYFNNIGSNNSSFGYNSLYSNSSGSYNSAFGRHSLFLNTAGNSNTAFGDSALASNTTGNNNVGFSHLSLSGNTTGSNNSAFGLFSMVKNTTGNNNTSLGYSSLNKNITGGENTALGYGSLNNSTFGFNTAVGNWALYSLSTGGYNVAVGYEANRDADVTNSIVIGKSVSFVPTNQIRLGNDNTVYAGIEVPWSITSDVKWKENIQTSELGIDFIKSLKPVSYLRKNSASKQREFGFLAQEVEQSLLNFNIKNAAMVNIDENGMYQLRYNDLISPVVKSIQELSIMKDSLILQNDQSFTDINNMQSGLNKLKEELIDFEYRQLDLLDKIKARNLKFNGKEDNITEDRKYEE